MSLISLCTCYVVSCVSVHFATTIFIYSFSIPLILIRFSVTRVLDSYPSYHWMSGGVTAWTGRRLSQGNTKTYETNSHPSLTLTSKGNLDSSINLHAFGLCEETGELKKKPTPRQETQKSPFCEAKALTLVSPCCLTTIFYTHVLKFTQSTMKCQ